MRMRLWLFAALAGSFLGCGNGTGEVVTQDLHDAAGEADAAQADQAAETPDDVRDEEVPQPEDVPRDDTQETAPVDVLPDALPGQPGAPCKGAAECASGFCIQTMEGMQCTMICDEECPFDWVCVQHTPSLPDVVSVCVPDNVDLCRPCRKNAECWTDGVDAGQACVAYGAAGSFCGAACEETLDCPEGYECAQVQDITAALVKQCRKADLACDCTKWQVDQAAGTDCFVENEWGLCNGERTCKAFGLTPCSAAVPAPEQCNGQDDDCDAGTDEELSGLACLVTSPFGACPGTTTCAGGKQTCDGKEAKLEACDGEDNDCDGQTDEGFPDTDLDGTADCLEADKDGDGIPDVQDNCQTAFNPKQEDFDLDNFGDACDLDDDNDQTADDKDCQPADPGVHPGAEEICDGQDNNCNYLVDEGFKDSDADGWKDCADDDDDDDGSPDVQDCGPTDPDVHPGGQEACDAKDNDCDSNIDEGFPDFDGDGVPDCGDTDSDGDGTPDAADCAPLNPAIHPGVEEVCDGLDNDCDYMVDEGFPDSDADSLKNCIDPDDDDDSDFDDSDCAPLDPTVSHVAVEKCDGKDNDCDGDVDEDLGSTPCGIGMCKHTVKNCQGGVTVICNPFEAALPEKCNGLDDDCDGQADEDLGTISCGKGKCFKTVPACQAGQPGTCDPLTGAEPEMCNGLDDDCDGQADEDLGQTTCGLGACINTVVNCIAGVPQVCNPFKGTFIEQCDGLDSDCDGQTDEDLGTSLCGIGQCLHASPNCKDGEPQECDPKLGAGLEACDAVDNDCDGQIDEDLGTTSCGTGLCAHTVPNCVGGQPTLCNPLEGLQVEKCDGVDNDCDGLVDEELGSSVCGLGACSHSSPNCANGLPVVCDPFQGAAAETCDGLDNDCDGLADEDLGTTSCGLGQCSHTVKNCDNGKLVTCDPKEGAAPETCDGLDNDCDGKVDPADTQGCIKFYLDLDADGYGQNDFQCLCQTSGDYDATQKGDCNDLDKEAYPAPHSVCGKDADCDGKLLDGGEQCDDGNVVSGDGCAWNCVKEPAKVFSEKVSGSPTVTLGTIPGVPGKKIVITRIGMCGDSDTGSGPNRFVVSGAGLSFSWATGQSPVDCTHWLAPIAYTGTGANGFTYADVAYTGTVGEGIIVTWDYHNDWDGHYCGATDSQGNTYNDSAVPSSLRAWILYSYE